MNWIAQYWFPGKAECHSIAEQIIERSGKDKLQSPTGNPSLMLKEYPRFSRAEGLASRSKSFIVGIGLMPLSLQARSKHTANAVPPMPAPEIAMRLPADACHYLTSEFYPSCQEKGTECQPGPKAHHVVALDELM